MRSLATLFVLLATCFAAGCEQDVKTKSPKVMTNLEEFRSKDKFQQVNDPALKSLLTERINEATTDFESLSTQQAASEKDYQDLIEKGLKRFDDVYVRIDTEDRERICSYFVELMDIFGVESSGGHLNNFMYGFDPMKK